MVKDIVILTCADYLEKIIYETTGFNKRAFTSSTSFLIIDLNEDQAGKIKARREYDCIDGNIIGVKDSVDILLNQGFLRIGQKNYYPDMVLGLNSKLHKPFFNTSHGWIFAQEPADLSKYFYLQTEILAGEWLRNKLKSQTKGYSLSIEDPYILKFDGLISLIDLLKSEESDEVFKYHKIAVKTNNSHDSRTIIKNNEKYLKNTIKDIEYFANGDEIHDRRVIVDGMIYILGNSLNMSKRERTYVLGIDKLTYKISRYEKI